ncbi:MAG: 23S rRNA (pseudouridine(1915)-N(3))-methyltransferase RlmH [Gammaproteobacteria bacterium]|nr:MAG: 23S rRNA (pseudouridine(1915)-N(3))-methyltransferase RlmH [Gammaproteobacteria bacterium]
MRIRLIAVGEKLAQWVTSGYHEYARRIRGDCRLELLEIAPANRKRLPPQKAVEDEGARILKHISHDHHVVALDVKGQAWSTEQLSQQLDHWLHLGTSVNLVIGGPEGLSPQVLSRANQCWSLGPLTFPHPLVRVIVAEALYRAWSLHHGHPYHRA